MRMRVDSWLIKAGSIALVTEGSPVAWFAFDTCHHRRPVYVYIHPKTSQLTFLGLPLALRGHGALYFIDAGWVCVYVYILFVVFDFYSLWVCPCPCDM